jgi:molecular chaperone HtpG
VRAEINILEGAMVEKTEVLQFQAETKQLLGFMVNSLYTNREIFLRELISNASDAIDRLRFESLTRPELLATDDKFEIRLEISRQPRTFTISDNGIGMSRDEVIANIGTIAKSGTRELCEMIGAEHPDKMTAEFIGNFGVGFYSSFMVADKVTLVTRRADESVATLWESTGDGHYTVSETEKAGRGTSITIHLRPSNPEEGIEDFTDKWVLARVVKRYSDFVSYPIIYKDEREAAESQSQDGKTADVTEDKVLNSMKSIWTRPQSEVTASEYAEFYKHISHDWNEPLKAIPLKAEGRVNYQALLFIPAQAPYDLFYHGTEFGLRLYAKRVMIRERCEELLPRYLRFVKGVVDSADLPLNISRQMLQQDRHITQIKKWLTKKVLTTLTNMYEKETDAYLKFWSQFGRALKEGGSSDYDNKDLIVSLLLFESSQDREKLTTLDDYVARMQEDQENIFYLTGESRKVVENSPHLEAFKEKGYEVLYLVDPVDELLVQSLTEFKDKKLRSVAKGEAGLGSKEEIKRAEEELRDEEKKCSELLEFIQKKIDEHVKQVRLTNRLTTSVACLVGSELDYSPQLEKLLQKGKTGGPNQRRILELNPKHQIFIKMRTRFDNNRDDLIFGKYAELILGYALLAEGSELPDPVEFIQVMAELMAQAL